MIAPVSGPGPNPVHGSRWRPESRSLRRRLRLGLARRRLAAARDATTLDSAARRLETQASGWSAAERAELFRLLALRAERLAPEGAPAWLERSLEARPTSEAARRLARKAFQRGQLARAARAREAWLALADPRGLPREDRTLADQIAGWHALARRLERGEVLEPRPSTTPAPSRPEAVLYALHNSLPSDTGGYATRADGLLRALRAGALDAVGVTRPGYPADRGHGDLPEPASRLDGIPYRRLAGPPLGVARVDAYLDASVARWSEAIRAHGAALVHAASGFQTGLPALRAARDLGLPTVYEVRGFWEVTRASRDPVWGASERYRVHSALETATARLADRVVTLNGSMRRELVARGVPAGRIVLVPNAVDPERFRPRPRDEALACELGLGGRPVIGYVGSLVDYEGLDALLRAAALLAGRGLAFTVLIVGGGPEAPRLERLARALGIRDRVRLVGRVPHAEVGRYYSLVDVAPFPRRSVRVTEMVSPMKPLEAMAMEKAVVVSGVAPLTELVEDGATGRVVPEASGEALAPVLEALLVDPDRRAALGRAARRFAARERSWAAAAARVAALYEELTGTPALPGHPAGAP
jgi:glycosyltransferase involved in cell wall biosynthesis